ncbi:hypothetical protein BGZ88_009537 [Linnemannia elongata]|nr:hypothetical protein BGZ88_009537 [Linnemannia elongata]
MTGLQSGEQTASENEDDDDDGEEEEEPKGWTKEGPASVAVSLRSRVPTSFAHIFPALDIPIKSRSI